MRHTMQTREFLRAYLDTVVITGENIGDIRRNLFTPWESDWNGWVREETAARENKIPLSNVTPRGTPPAFSITTAHGGSSAGVMAGAAPREATFEQDLHADAMALAYDDANEWQGRCPKGYKANLLAQRIEELVERLLAAHGAARPAPAAEP